MAFLSTYTPFPYPLTCSLISWCVWGFVILLVHALCKYNFYQIYAIFAVTTSINKKFPEVKKLDKTVCDPYKYFQIFSQSHSWVLRILENAASILPHAAGIRVKWDSSEQGLTEVCKAGYQHGMCIDFSNRRLPSKLVSFTGLTQNICS